MSTFPDSGDTAWMLTSSAFVLFMTPGLALFYAGLVRTKSSLNMIAQNMATIGVMTIQWFVIGYSLAFDSGNEVFGSLHKMFFSSTNLGNAAANGLLAPTVPDQVFAIYQMMFAIITPALMTGSTADRMKFHTYLVFVFVWGTIVYDPVCHMIWHPDGWMFKKGVLDYAGGLVVHLSAASSALVACLMLGPREGYGTPALKAHSPLLVTIGTGMLWFGWFGFNAGSALSASQHATIAFVSSQIACGFAGITWMILEWMIDGHPTVSGLCTGFVAGLAAVTPASGFIDPLPAMAIGVICTTVAFFAIKMRIKLAYDDALDVFAVHGCGAALGVFLTGIFARSEMFAYDDSTQRGGWLSNHWEQLGWQVCGIAVVAAWSVTFTYGILWTLDRMPGFGLRVSKEDELRGLDAAVHGEFMYNNDDLALHTAGTWMHALLPSSAQAAAPSSAAGFGRTVGTNGSVVPMVEMMADRHLAPTAAPSPATSNGVSPGPVQSSLTVSTPGAQLGIRVDA